MTRTRHVVSLVVLSIAIAPLAQAQGRARDKPEPIDPAGIARIVAESGAQVSVHEATGAARFVRLAPGRKQGQIRRGGGAEGLDARKRRSSEFFEAHGSIFGITDAARELEEARIGRDRQGGTHITYRQVYRGVPVFAAELRSHFDASGELVAVNGTFVPRILVDPNPRLSAGEAGKAAVAKVEGSLERAGQLKAVETTLLVFREGLAKGVPGPNHLAWQVEVGDGAHVREFVYIDAHSGKFVDQITGVQDDLYRRAYDGLGLPNVPPSYPGSPFWIEGDTFPSGVAEADNMILASKDTFDLFSNAFGRDSFDGAGGVMDSIFNRGYSCPNASWNGTFISFCPGLTTDDVTGHEWTHAYTQYTHNLIYQWQPGALNESYSDIFGETVDRINGRGGDTPGGPRASNGANCSAFQLFAPETKVNSPVNVAGEYSSGTSAFSPTITFANGVTADLVRPDDGVVVGSTATDGCGEGPSFLQAPNSWTNAAQVAGKIVLVDRGVCGFAVKALNAQRNGAIGVIIANMAASANPTVPPNMGGTTGAEAVTIPVTSMNLANGDLLRSELAVPNTVNATLQPNAPGTTDNSLRWLLGEDDAAPGLTGALRDMWNPTCFGNAGKVSDTQYTCSTADGGGVHSNSGVPNHAFALLVDGGTYNGQTVTGIGLTKAAHIYFRAMDVYQGPATDFAEHADALDQSCSDLVGVNLADLSTGGPSGEIIASSDCTQVANAALAVELRNPPVQCNFQPLLAKTPPPLCQAGRKATPLFLNRLDNGRLSIAGWSVSHTALTADFTPRDWQVVSGLPDDRPGKAFFGADPDIGTCAPGGDESGVLHLVSPKVTIPASVIAPRLTFDHWVATEGTWDGGNLKISVNGRPWVPIQATDFLYNPYNATLATAAQGNTNPIAGEPAFSGTDGGQVGGSWGRSIVNLAPYAKPKDKIRLRFDIGNDGCGGNVGWYVDDVLVYRCQ